MPFAFHRQVLPVAVVAMVACTPDGPAPGLSALEPEWGFSGADTEVRITGDRFLPLLEATGARDISVDDRFSVVLETSPPTPLTNVERLSDSVLTAVVPAGVEPGRYDVRVTSPAGGSDTLVDGFTVTDTRAATVSLSTPAVRFDVGEDARVGLQLRDLSGSDVPAAIRIEVRAVAASGDPSAVVFESGLIDQELVAPGVIRGALDSGGGAELYFTSTIVDDVALRVLGQDLNTHIDVTSPQLRFEPAAIDRVEVKVEESPLTAGVPTTVELRLRDSDGNQTRGELLVATVQETCSLSGGGYVDVVTINDQLQLEDVILTGATVDGACSENRIRVVGVVGGEPIVAESEPLVVLPGAIDHYSVSALSESVVAGEDAQTLVVVAEDAWSNPVVDHADTLSLEDNLGGLSPNDGIGAAACGPFFDGRAVCIATLERSGTRVTVRATSSRGTTGVSPPFIVEAGPPSILEVTVPSGPFEAGASILVQTATFDAFENATSLDHLGGASAVQLSDTTGSLACSARFAGPAPGLAFSSCAIYTANDTVQISAELPALPLSATSSPFVVTNAPLDSVEFTLTTSNVEAGVPLHFQVAAFDAYGNPYIEQATSNIIVADTEGELTGSAVTLNSAGAGTGTATFTRATDENRLVGKVFGTEFGLSAPFSVEAGPHAGYAIELGTSWVEVLDTLSVDILAVDEFGNARTDVDSTLQLRSTTDAGDAVDDITMTDGFAQTAFTWDTVVLQDILQVEDSLFSDLASPIDVVDLSCAAPPSADLTVAGESDLRLCLVGTQTSSVTVSASGSTEGGAPLEAYHFDLGSNGFSRDTQAFTSARWTGDGGRVVQVLVVDADGCADLATARVWVGESNGEPVGPVSVVLDDSTLTAGSASGGTTDVELAAWDCAGDPASGGSLHVRAELGQVLSGSSLVSSTGQGLVVVLDANGEGTISWSVAAEDVDGAPRLHAGVTSGAAHGSASATVSGDARSPRVVEHFPVGRTLDSWSTLQVAFDEPMYSASLTPSAVTVLDPDGTAVDITAVSLTDSGRLLTIEPAAPIDGALGEWTLSLASSVRDDGGGNFLDGDWAGAPSAYSTRFGAIVESAPAVTGCPSNTPSFRPDGDNGSGVEADSVAVAVFADSLPSWWWLEVWDDSNEVVAWLPTPASSNPETLSWDGRGSDGLIVPAGTYTLVVSALDSNRAENTACSVDVIVDHPIGPPDAP